MYTHRVNYYETDKMGIVHHSNYIRFMEEARVQFFKDINFDYFELEKQGIFSPVVALNNCKYRKPTHFGDDILIDIKIKQYNGIRLVVQYKMFTNDTLVFEGESEHCFISQDGKLIKLDENNFGALHNKLTELVEK